MQAFKKIIQSRYSVLTRMYSIRPKIFLTNKTPQRILSCNKNNHTDNFGSFFLIINRHKFKKSSKTRVKDEEYESDSDSDEEINNDPNSKLITGRMQSLRVDAVLKVGLGLARNKVEMLFYEDRILVNGKNIVKKSVKVDVGDEIDVIKGSKEDQMLSVSRVIITSAVPNDNSDGFIVKMKRYKNLVIENS